MAMKVATFNDCKVYNLSSGKTMPQWLSDAKKRSLLKDDEYRKRLELIQDFEMTVAAQCIKMTKDGEHIIVTGTYPPVVRCYTVSDLAMKFQRGLTCDVVAFETLSDDFGKLVFLQSDRTISFHAPYGTHYNVRVPKFGRDIVYNWNNCDLYVGASGNDVYRLNLETGQFKEPFELSFQGCNKVHINPMHNLLGFGGEEASCEFWDPRSRSSVSKIQVDALKTVEVTALKFDNDGLTLGVGTSNGNCILYDIRSTKPMYTKEHQYGLPIIDVTFHNNNSTKYVISTDKKIVKIWERNEPFQGKILTNIETPANINSIHIVEDKKGSSGLIMMAGEQTRVMTYFVPNLGHAPRWCSFLESLTEELEESSSQNVYEDYKFITQKEVEDLGAISLIGTPLLKGYMHGYFIEMKLYNKMRAVSKPFEYEEYRLAKIKEKINEKRSSRITPRKRLPKVNKNLAQKLLNNEGNSSSKNKKKIMNDNNDGDKSDGKTKSLIDDRFAALFKREEFEQDTTSHEYKLRNPVSSNYQRRGNGDADSEDDENDDLYNNKNNNNNNNNNDDDYSDDDDDDDDDDKEEDGDDYNNSDADDDNDINEFQSARAASKKRKGVNDKKSQVEDEEEEEDGQILKATKRSVARQQSQKQSRHHSSSSSNNSNKRRPPVMSEPPSGVSATKAIFASHIEKGRNNSSNSSKNHHGKFQSIDDIPLSKRLSSFSNDKSNNSNSNNNSNKNNSKRGRMGNDDNVTNANGIKTIHSAKDGVMREISFMPQSDSKGGDKNRFGTRKTRDSSGASASSVTSVVTGGNKKESRMDKERAHFIG